MEDQLLTYTKYDATFTPSFIQGITWVMNDKVLGGSALVVEDVSSEPFDLKLETPIYTYLFKGFFFPDGAEKLQVKSFLADEVVISE